MICAPAHGFDEFRDAVRDAGFLAETGPVSGNRVPSRMFTGHDGNRCGNRPPMVHNLARRATSGEEFGLQGTGK